MTRLKTVLTRGGTSQREPNSLQEEKSLETLQQAFEADYFCMSKFLSLLPVLESESFSSSLGIVFRFGGHERAKC